MGNIAGALELYASIHIKHPDNMECLRYLVALSRDLGRRADTYEVRLSKLERTFAAAAAAAAAAEAENDGDLGDYAGGGYDAQQYEQQQPVEATREPARLQHQQQQQQQIRGGGGGDNEHFAAPTAVAARGGSRNTGAGGGGKHDEDNFGDADVGALLG